MNRIADAASERVVVDVDADGRRVIDEHDGVDAEPLGSAVDTAAVEQHSRVDGEEHPLIHWARMIEDIMVVDLQEPNDDGADSPVPLHGENFRFDDIVFEGEDVFDLDYEDDAAEPDCGDDELMNEDEWLL